MSEDADKAQIDEEIQDNLRRVYRAKVEEDVPDHLIALLKRLKSEDEGD